MSAFFSFSINGVPSCANRKLLTDILRDEWGFTGYVVSDDGALRNVVEAHHFINNSVDAAAYAVKAGANLEVSSPPEPALFQHIGECSKTSISLKIDVICGLGTSCENLYV